MRNLLVAATIAFLLSAWSVTLGRAQEIDFRAEKHLIKVRHSQERKAMKAQQKIWKRSLKNHEVPKAMRVQMVHQMQRQERELKERQRNERQDMQDRKRLVKENQRRF